MAKKVFIYLFGVATGVIIVLIIAAATYKEPKESQGQTGYTLFDSEGECVSDKSFKVVQVIENGDALANEVPYSGLLALFKNNGKTSYYDEQIIEIPPGKCAIQIGLFRYKTLSGMNKTVPIVEIHDK